GGFGGGGGSAAVDDNTFVSRQSTNWPISLELTSANTPRPNCATLPVTAKSVATVTFVPLPSETSVAVMVALALPCPRVSRPSARRTALWAVSSFSTKVAFPLYWAVIGPTLTFTMPRYSSPSISCSWAPGMQGAMRSTSVSSTQASSTPTGTTNSLLSSMAQPPSGGRSARPGEAGASGHLTGPAGLLPNAA